MGNLTRRPTPPTSSLPPLARLASCSPNRVAEALENLRYIYVPQTVLGLPAESSAKHLPEHLIHDNSVPDSGYASAEEDEDECPTSDADELDALCADSFEREHAIRWLTGFTARSDTFVFSASSDEESDARAALVDNAAAILASFAGDEEEDEDITRRFAFATQGGDEVAVELNDAPLLSEDHTSVGLQSWASSVHLSERICASPDTFGLGPCARGCEPRVLELGAGTGLLSIAAAKLLQQHAPSHTLAYPVVATDFHPSVLANLQANVDTNFPPCSDAQPESTAPIVVRALDWEHPVYTQELARPFDVILAADVVYHPSHARWIKNCVERLLVRADDGSQQSGVFWLIIALRSTGRHEGMSDTVEEVFPPAEKLREGVSDGKSQLAILSLEKLERQEGLGRVDEGGYVLYRIGWV
ncbi:hypothetical protein WOLCODRAFT_22688 [Wolfiporia cocos MD-104 SS10]|uniref:S-adenosyl-L-methionine-dependent methyltransferase n=1 Tax=Wolfiporia cocos (strain MD-104) TaxID=742152 RepID=A0A2H3J3S1_WOLCO|nr:hypothetical protein WOLCODRAFT_22688 [Wolfiporia cocos MD-104 SS10]